MNEFTAPLYETAVAVEAAEIPDYKLTDWLTRKIIAPTLPARGAGYVHRFSRNAVMQIAIAYRLWLIGFSPVKAAKFAAAFSHESTSERPAGALFTTGRTFLAIVGNDVAKVVNVPTGSSLPTHGDQAAVYLYLNALVAMVEPNLIERRYIPGFVVRGSLSAEERAEAVDTFITHAATLQVSE